MNIWTIGMTIEDSEKVIIMKALQFFHFNKTATAKSLGISVRGMDNKIKKFGIVINRNLGGKVETKNIKSDI